MQLIEVPTYLLEPILNTVNCCIINPPFILPTKLDNEGVPPLYNGAANAPDVPHIYAVDVSVHFMELM